jgi:hypothetical protein
MTRIERQSHIVFQSLLQTHASRICVAEVFDSKGQRVPTARGYLKVIASWEGVLGLSSSKITSKA